MGQFSHGTQIYHSLDNVIIFPPEISMIGTLNALGDYTLPSSFCTTKMIWHELDALINQTRCGKTVQLCWRGPDYSRWLKPNPLRSLYFSSLQMYQRFGNTTTMKSWCQNKHLRTWTWEPHRGECPGWPCLTLWLCSWKAGSACLFKVRMSLVSFYSMRQECLHQTTEMEL